MLSGHYVYNTDARLISSNQGLFKKMESELLDSLNTVQTPEGVDIHLRLAGVWPRSVAWVVDALIRTGIYIVLGIAFSFLGDLGRGFMLIGIFLIEWFYPVVFEVLNQGMTPGKKSLGIQVLNSDGTPIGWSASLLRNILRTVDFLPFMYGLGFVSMLMNDRFQRLGDLAADTVVVYQSQPAKLPEIPLQAAATCSYDLNLNEQQAVILYAERTHQLSEDRLEELASILNPMDVPEKQMTKIKLLAIANGLIGRK